MKTIVIEVRGGVVQAVYADEGVRAILVDWDEFEEDAATTGACVFPVDKLSLAPIEVEATIASTND